MSRRFLLKSLGIRDFRAVRRGGTVRLSPLTAFIGDKGSGKSGAIEAMETYRSIVLEGLDVAVGRWRGFEPIGNKRARRREGASLSRIGRLSPRCGDNRA